MSKNKDAEIAVTSRVRLARNLSDLPFGDSLGTKGHELLWERSSAAFEGIKGFDGKTIGENNSMEAQALVERHLISPELAAKNGKRGVFISEDKTRSVMVGEEDHIRIQVLSAGLDLSSCLERAVKLDDALDDKLDYAFSERWGHLTTCPTNLGTGLRASVMLHLPALTENGAMRGISVAAGQTGMALRGFYGEGSSAVGAYYQVSNQVTLGLTEDEIISRVAEISRHMISQERAARDELKKHLTFRDRIWRAYGLLSNARLLNTQDAMQNLSLLRMGLDLLPDVKLEELQELLYEIQPATITMRAGKQLSSRERDELRATLCREKIG